MNNNQSKKRNPLIIVVAIVALMAVAFSGITVYAKVIQPKKYGEYIEQGNQYLNQNMYEDAIMSFDKAIKIDDKSIEARIGASKAYVGMNKSDKAGTYLYKAQELDLKNEDLTLEMISIIKDADRDIASKLLQNYIDAVGYDNTSDKFRNEVLESTDNESLEDFISKAQSLYDNSVEGEQNGNYELGSKEELLKVIEKAKQVDEGYFYTQDEVDEIATELLAAISDFESKKVMVMPSNLGDIYRSRIAAVDNNPRYQYDSSWSFSDERNRYDEQREKYEEKLDDICEDITSYFPDKAQEIRNYRNAFEQEKYNREQSAIEDAKLAGGGNGWGLDVISQNRDSAREKCYEVINKYM